MTVLEVWEGLGGASFTCSEEKVAKDAGQVRLRCKASFVEIAYLGELTDIKVRINKRYLKKILSQSK